VKITKLSLAAIAAMTLTTGAMADVDMKIGGQTVVYYQTNDAGTNDMFAESASSANVGIQLNANADIGNGYGLGFQGTALNTVGLEGNLVDGVMQSGLGNDGDTANAANYFAFTKAYLTKKLGNTQLKLGRQELPKSLSPLAFSEGWNVYKNTFDAAVAINTDIEDTTIVGAFVSRSNRHGNLNAFGALDGTAAQTITPATASTPDTVNLNTGVVTPGTPAVAANTQNKGAYMLTVQNKSVAGLTPTLSYYQLPSSAKAVWLDLNADMIKLAGAPVKVALQGGQIMPNASGAVDSKALGLKVSGKAGPAVVSLAYSKTNNGTVATNNLGTGVKTPLYTQMVANQGDIKDGAEGTVLKVVMPAGPGKVIAQYGMMKDNINKNSDVQELDLMYKFKALGADMFGAVVVSNADDKVYNGDDSRNIIRLWTRYNF
jgi:hypothetical protein